MVRAPGEYSINVELDQEIVQHLMELLGETERDVVKMLQCAIEGRETTNDKKSIESWVLEQLTPNLVFIDFDGYSRMCIAALQTISTQVLTDFGSSRQRDLSQAWADKTRGYLGEFAVVKFIKDNFAVETRLAHQQGAIDEFLPSDIAEVKDAGGWRKPLTNVGIKTAKLTGMWLDVPNAQYAASNYHVQVKTGAGTTHLFSFFKSLEIFERQILKLGVDGGYLDPAEAKSIIDDIPDFKPIPAYVSGFAVRDFDYGTLNYKSTFGRTNHKIYDYRGFLPLDYIQQIRKAESTPSAKVEFLRIGEFSSNGKYVFSSHSLQKSRDEWQDLVNRL